MTRVNAARETLTFIMRRWVLFHNINAFFLLWTHGQKVVYATAVDQGRFLTSEMPADETTLVVQ